MNTYENLWQKILHDLEHTFNEDIYTEVFEPIKNIHKYQDGILYVVACNEFNKNRINRLYINKINSLAKKYHSDPIRFKFIVNSEIEKEETITTIESSLVNKYTVGNLNRTYTFKNFVVGKSNFFAFRTSSLVADQLTAIANPLYIFGDVGLGKTHLMQAIGNFVFDSDISKKILYIKADEFIEEFANHLKSERMEDFNSKYREIDVLLVDDIQILGGANKTQMEFFKLFDFLFNQNKQIVITSDKPANELKNIMSRLTSRFQAGLSVDIRVPDLEHRKEILKKKLSIDYPNSVNISEDVLEFIASSFTTNIRELEGALKRVVYYCLTNNITPTLENAREALEQILKTKKKSQSLSENNYDRIQSITADFYGISLEDMISKKRHNKFALPRHIAMYLIKSNYNIPYKTIGSLFGDRNHSTVLLACEKIEFDIKSDEMLKKAIENITKKINNINLN